MKLVSPLFQEPTYSFRHKRVESLLNQLQALLFGNETTIDKCLWKVPLKAIQVESPQVQIADIDAMIMQSRLHGLATFSIPESCATILVFSRWLL